MNESVITLEEAIKVAREIEEKLKEIGYHCGLTGSTLYKGESRKDIDIIVYPHDSEKQKTLDEILEHLAVNDDRHYPSQRFFIPSEITPSTTDKLVIVTMFKGIRVDLFFLT